MTFIDSGKGAVARSGGRPLGAVMVAAVLVAAAPMPAMAETVLERKAVSNVLSTAVTNHFHSTVKRNIIESACYFDPQVTDSMRCSFRWVRKNSGADRFYMRDQVEMSARTWCREAGGRNCTLFLRNDELQFDGLSPDQSERLESVLRKIPSLNPEAKPLPDGIDLASGFREWFPRGRDYFDDRRRQRKFKNYHFAICTNSAGARSWANAQGGGVNISEIRSRCVLRCAALSEMYSEEGNCYVVYEDGKFASAAAEAALAE